MQTSAPVTSLDMTPDIERANTRHLYFELAWMGIAFAMEWYYMNVYAIKLNATPVHLGVLASGRALMLAIGSGLAHRWLQRFNNVIPALTRPLLIARFFLYAMIALVPFLPAYKVEVMVAMIVLSGLPQGISQGVFLGMVPQAINKKNMAQVVSNRSVLMNATVLLSMFVVGQFLERIPSPMNYQLGFLLAFLAGFMSWWNIRKIVTPNLDQLTKVHMVIKNTESVWAYKPFQRFAVITVVVNVSVFMAGPLVQLHWVRGLGATDSWISLFGIFEMAAGALLTLRIAPLLRRFGARKLIIATTFATAVQMVIFAVTPILPPILIGQVLFGAGWFAVNVLLYNRMVEIVPAEEISRFAATYQMLINASLFVGPLIGTFLIQNIMTIPAAMLLIAGMRFAASFMAWAVKIEAAHEHSATTIRSIETA
jgi:predicted MFS family arabinose efflux permease